MSLRYTLTLSVCGLLVLVPAPAFAGAAAGPRRDPATATALRRLHEGVTVVHPEPSPLEDVLKAVGAATRGPDGREVRIALDRSGLRAAGRSAKEPASVVSRGETLHRCLVRLLGPMGLTYGVVDDGVILVKMPPR